MPTDTSGYTSPRSYPGYNLVWSDEFNTSAIDTANWNFETGDSAWGNSELEKIIHQGHKMQSSGNLVIEARLEEDNGNNYTTVRLTTQYKRQCEYGRIDIRAKLPVRKGIWPALWMPGTNIPEAGWSHSVKLISWD